MTVKSRPSRTARSSIGHDFEGSLQQFYQSMNLDDKKAIIGWGVYDWANSAFATTIMAGFFPVFFKQFWSVGVDPTMSTARLGLANAIAGIMVALAAPALGAIADKGTSKKKFLLFFAYFGAVMTSSLTMVSK